MKKSLVSIGVLLMAGSVFAQSLTTLATAQYDGKTKIRKSHEAIDANFAAVGGGLNGSLNVTNGQAVTTVSGTYILNGVGGANNSTNTITVANMTAGERVTFIVDSASTNLIAIADSGNMKLSAAWLGDNNDALKVEAAAAAVIVETSRSDN